MPSKKSKKRPKGMKKKASQRLVRLVGPAMQYFMDDRTDMTALWSIWRTERRRRERTAAEAYLGQLKLDIYEDGG